MSLDDMSERVAVLESEVKLLRADQERVLAKLDSISIQIAKHVPCPEPGACLRLAQDVAAIKNQIEVLEADRNQRKGERGIIAIVCTLLGACVSLLVNWVTKSN
jgi:uncharacterized small protein (DUF1192 family)